MASDQTLLDTHGVCRLLGVSRSTLWRLRELGQFPPPIQLSERRIAWRRADIEAWLEARKRAAGA